MDRKRPSPLVGALLGALAALPLITITYLAAEAFDLPFPPFDVFDAMTRLLPGALVTFGIDTMVSLITALDLGDTSAAAKTAEQTIAVLQLVAGAAVFGAVLAWLGRGRQARLPLLGAIGGAVLCAVTLAATTVTGFPAAGVVSSVVWLVLVFLAWGWLLGLMIRLSSAGAERGEAPHTSRREFVVLVGAGVVAAVAGAVGLGALLRRGGDAAAPAVDADALLEGAAGTSGPAASPQVEALDARFEPVRGTRPEITPNPDFYRIDINTGVPDVDGGAWRLEVSGLVDERLALSLDELRAMPARSQFLTLSCISNRVGGDLIGTTRWTGVRLKDVMERAGMRRGVRSLYVEAQDGFYETVSLEDVMDDRTLLVYEMNGVALPAEHGFPLRVYIPNRYGMKQPKWIQRIEATDEVREGYWVERGWSLEARPKTTSVIDAVAMTMMVGQDEVVPIGGIAWAGARGIDRVELQVDDGPWQRAELRGPPLSPLTWVQWRMSLPYEAGTHVFRVRAVDGDGEVQTSRETGPRPDGATGYHEMRVSL